VIIEKILNCFWAFVLITIYGMLLIYIVQIKSQLVDLVKENINLFDRMHEGVVLVSESDQSLQFASNPAVNLLLQEPERGILESNLTLNNSKASSVSQKDLSKPIFYPLEVSVKNVQNLAENYSFNLSDGSVSG
jgi:hypothetical protein